MARTVSDVVFLDSVITGEQIELLPSLSGLRIGIPRADYWDGDEVDPAVADCLKTAFAKLKDAGVELVEIDLRSLFALGDQMAQAAGGGASQTFAEWLAENVPGLTEQDVRNRPAPAPTAAATAPRPQLSPEEQANIRAKGTQQYADVFKSAGIIALAFPSEPIPPPPINPNGDSPQDQLEIKGKLFGKTAVMIRNTFWSARLGAPGLTLPAGLTVVPSQVRPVYSPSDVNVPAGITTGLPVGLELDGLPDDDNRILALGLAVEKLLGPVPPPAMMRKTT